MVMDDRYIKELCLAGPSYLSLYGSR